MTISGGSPASGAKLGPAGFAKSGKEGKNGEAYFGEATAKIRSAVGGEGKGGIPVIGVAGWHLALYGEWERGLALLRKVIEVEFIGDFEFQMAQSYLGWNEVPKTARAAIPAG